MDSRIRAAVVGGAWIRTGPGAESCDVSAAQVRTPSYGKPWEEGTWDAKRKKKSRRCRSLKADFKLSGARPLTGATYTLRPPSGGAEAEHRAGTATAWAQFMEFRRRSARRFSRDREGFFCPGPARGEEGGVRCQGLYDEGRGVVKRVYYKEGRAADQGPRTGAEPFVFVFAQPCAKSALPGSGRTSATGGSAGNLSRACMSISHRGERNSGPQAPRSHFPEAAEGKTVEGSGGDHQPLGARFLGAVGLNSDIAVCDARHGKAGRTGRFRSGSYPERVGDENQSVEIIIPDHQWFYVPGMTA